MRAFLRLAAVALGVVGVLFVMGGMGNIEYADMVGQACDIRDVLTRIIGGALLMIPIAVIMVREGSYE